MEAKIIATAERIAAEQAKSEKSRAEASRKLRIHVVCIAIGATISFVLFALHIDNPALLGFTPASPSIVQEICDRIFEL